MSGISVLIPVYNEEKILVRNVKRLTKFLRKLRIPYEIILCDNGSTDKTPILGRKLESELNGKLRFLSIGESRCVGSAFKEMVREASFENLISLDMDLSIDFEFFIKECLKLLKHNSMVIGTKIAMQKRPLYRRVMSRVFILLTKLLLNLKYTDYSIGAKAYRKSKIVSMLDSLDKKTFYVVELIFFLDKNGERIVEVPVEVVDVRKSKFNIFYDALYRGTNLLRFWFEERIIKKIPRTVASLPRTSTSVSA